MPTIYVSGQFSTTVTLTDEDEYFEEQWNDKALFDERKKAGKSTVGFWIHIPNPEDEISPFAFAVNDIDMYEGSFGFEKKGNQYIFKFDGRAKVNAHKSVKSAVDSGMTGPIHSISISGEGYSFDQPVVHALIVQGKKP